MAVWFAQRMADARAVVEAAQSSTSDVLLRTPTPTMTLLADVFPRTRRRVAPASLVARRRRWLTPFRLGVPWWIPASDLPRATLESALAQFRKWAAAVRRVALPVA